MKNAAYAALSHDPLCRQQHWDGGDCFDCRLIAKVRADERERHTVNNPLLLADLRAEVQVMKDEAGQVLLHAETTDEVTAASVGISVLDDMLALFDGSE